jgi:DNA replication protein DnaC
MIDFRQAHEEVTGPESWPDGECGWELADPESLTLTADVREAIGLGKADCPLCERDRAKAHNDFEESRIWPLWKGSKTGSLRTFSRACPCATWRRYYPTFNAAVPAHDRFVRLETLEPSDTSQLTRRQQLQMLEQLRESPGASYAFFGPAGTSKTTFCVALYQHALAHACRGHEWETRTKNYTTELLYPHIWRISAKALLDEFVMYATSDDKRNNEPTITRRKIEQAARRGRKPHLFLEEIDKVVYTQYKTNSIFEIFDAMYEHEGQLVFNSNLPLAKFEALFGEETGPAMVRRVSEMCQVYDLFEDVKQ